MKKFGFAMIAAGALTAGFLGLAAPAMAAPSAVTNAQDTITSLEAEGYDVVVHHLSDVPLNEADVVSVGMGQSFAQEASNTTEIRQFGPVARATVYVNVK